MKPDFWDRLDTFADRGMNIASTILMLALALVFLAAGTALFTVAIRYAIS